MKKVDLKIFEVNNFTFSTMEIGNALNRVVVVEDFFKYPDMVREYALSCGYFDLPDSKNPGVVSKIAAVLNEVNESLGFIKQTAFGESPVIKNSLNVATFQAYRTNNNNAPHYDFFQYAAVCSLNTPEENPGLSGTSFLRYKDGHEYASPGTYRSRVSTEEIHENWTEYHTEWHKYNKLIMYEGYMYHNLNWDESNWTSDIPRLTFNVFLGEDI